MDYDGTPSDAQIKFAKDLGIEFDSTTTAGRLSALITKARNDQPPSEAQVQFAINLGIEFDPTTITKGEMSKLLDAEVAKQSRDALRSNPALRIGKVVMYKDVAYRIDDINRKKWKLRLEPCRRTAGATAKWVMIITLKDAVEVELGANMRSS